jgi:Myb/SANT-like DNA-binding domain
VKFETKPRLKKLNFGGKMLTKSQKRTLAALVRQNQGLLFAKFGPGVTRKRKEEVWEAIRQKLIR